MNEMIKLSRAAPTMTTPNFRALCAELVDDLACQAWKDESDALLDRARAALAEPEPPFDGEVAEVVAWLRKGCQEENGFQTYSQIQCLLDRAADLLERLAAEPVPEGPSDEEIMGLMPQQMHDDLAAAARALAGTENKRVRGIMRIMLNRHVVDHARAVLDRWGSAN